MPRLIQSVLVLLMLLIPISSSAGLSPKIDQAVRDAYPAAEWHHGLETAYEDPDPAKLRGYVVVLQGGIPAERGRHFVTWEDYDYRGVTLHLDRGDEITTRRGKVYTFLQPGTVMAVADRTEFNTTIYFKLISAEAYVPEDRTLEKHHSRVTVMLGFKFPKGMLKSDDDQAVMATLGLWLKPFKGLEDAKAAAAQLRASLGAPSLPAAPSAKEEAAAKKGKAAKGTPLPVASEGAVAAGTAGSTGTAGAEPESKDAERIQSLEERIEKTRRELEQAEKDLGEIKKSK